MDEVPNKIAFQFPAFSLLLPSPTSRLPNSLFQRQKIANKMPVTRTSNYDVIVHCDNPPCVVTIAVPEPSHSGWTWSTKDSTSLSAPGILPCVVRFLGTDFVARLFSRRPPHPPHLRRCSHCCMLELGDYACYQVAPEQQDRHQHRADRSRRLTRPSTSASSTC